MKRTKIKIKVILFVVMMVLSIIPVSAVGPCEYAEYENCCGKNRFFYTIVEEWFDDGAVIKMASEDDCAKHNELEMNTLNLCQFYAQCWVVTSLSMLLQYE